MPTLTVRIGRRSREYRLGLPGEHRVLTSLAVFAALFALDADIDAALPHFASVTVPKGRGNAVPAGNATVIDDSYNANPVSMRFALEALAVEEGRRVAILGEMLELGDDTRAMHAEIEPACTDLDGVITVGDGFRDWGSSLGDRHWAHVASVAELDLEALADRIMVDGTNATILVKGANKVFWVNQFVDSLSTALAASG
ncbi:MAG: cyanophycin synthetase [Gammaproteobacteria bacterium]|nr:cyanophycin synthetase [Gammaproteobacteria bacterium]